MIKRLKPLALAVVLLSLGRASAQAASYSIDPVHSKIEFKVKHLSISTVSGRFEKYSGTFEYDLSNPSAWKAETHIEAASINTDVDKRDADLRSPNFLDVTKYPEIAFVSTGVKDAGKEGFKLMGNLTIHGVTKPVVLDTEIGGEVKDPWGGERAAFTASTKIDRRDYGIVWNKTLEGGGFLVGNEVKIILEVEGVKKK